MPRKSRGMPGRLAPPGWAEIFLGGRGGARIGTYACEPDCGQSTRLQIAIGILWMNLAGEFN